MDYSLLWKTITIFNFFFALIWICFYTYRADFMNDGDFVDPVSGSRGTPGIKNNNDSFLSMAGRSLIFLIAIISSLIIAMIFFISFNYYIKPTYKCKKGKGLKECKLVK